MQYLYIISPNKKAFDTLRIFEALTEGESIKPIRGRGTGKTLFNLAATQTTNHTPTPLISYSPSGTPLPQAGEGEASSPRPSSLTLYRLLSLALAACFALSRRLYRCHILSLFSRCC